MDALYIRVGLKPLQVPELVELDVGENAVGCMPIDQVDGIVLDQLVQQLVHDIYKVAKRPHPPIKDAPLPAGKLALAIDQGLIRCKTCPIEGEHSRWYKRGDTSEEWMRCSLNEAVAFVVALDRDGML